MRAQESLAGEPMPQVEVMREGPTVFRDTFRITIGGFWALSETSAYYTELDNVAAAIDFEKGLGMDDSNVVPFIGFRWRFADRWSFDMSYFEIDRNGKKRLQYNIEWGDDVYQAGTVVKSRLYVSDLRATVNYSFFQRSDKELGVGFGLHAMKLDGTIDEKTLGQEREDVLAPLPVASFYANLALTERWAMTTRLDWLSIKYDKFEGDLRSIGIDFIYQASRHVSMGFGLRTLNLDVDYTGDSYIAGMTLDLEGPEAFVSYSF